LGRVFHCSICPGAVFTSEKKQATPKKGDRTNYNGEKLAELEMQALKAQINPHFVF
jgi:hypothetical protein